MCLQDKRLECLPSCVTEGRLDWTGDSLSQRGIIRHVGLGLAGYRANFSGRKELTEIKAKKQELIFVLLSTTGDIS